MMRRFCRSKIHRAVVTHSHLEYEGSIEIDQTLMEAAAIEEYEMVLVANLSTGERFETYVIKGRRNSGVIGLNGAAARLGLPGDKLIIMAIALVGEGEPPIAPRFIRVDEKNRVLRRRPR